MPIYEYNRDNYADDPAGNPRSAFIVGAAAGALAGALIVAFVWLGVAGLGPGDDPAPPDHEANGPAALPSTAPSSAEGPEETHEPAALIERCQEVFAAQSAPLQAASVSLEQWEVHIGAMNKLVTGAITLNQATQFWNQTRVGASTKLRRFDSALEGFQQRSARCPEPSNSGAGLLPELRDCYRAVAARNETLRLATVSLGTWKGHVHHMEMLRRGEMTAQQATSLWLQSWQTGNDEVHAYRAAARAANGKTC